MKKLAVVQLTLHPHLSSHVELPHSDQFYLHLTHIQSADLSCACQVWNKTIYPLGTPDRSSLRVHSKTFQEKNSSREMDTVHWFHAHHHACTLGAFRSTPHPDITPLPAASPQGMAPVEAEDSYAVPDDDCNLSRIYRQEEVGSKDLPLQWGQVPFRGDGPTGWGYAPDVPDRCGPQPAWAEAHHALVFLNRQTVIAWKRWILSCFNQVPPIWTDMVGTSRLLTPFW